MEPSKFLEEETLDLSHCCVCTELYNNLERKPKFLPCYHTYCLTCIKAMITLPSTTRLNCPKCKLFCKVAGGVVEKLPTNMYALHITTLLGITHNELWCLTCKALPKSHCKLESHIIVDWSEDVEEIGSMMASICSNYKTSITKRKDYQEHTDKTITFLEQKLVELKSERASNQRCLNELCLSMENSDLQMKDLSSTDKQTVSFHSIRKILKKKHLQAEEESKQSDLLPSPETMTITRQLLCQVILLNSEIQESEEIGSSLIMVEKTKIEEAKMSLPAAGRSRSKRVQSFLPSFNCRNLKSHSNGVNVLEYSDDGRFFAYGGWNRRVLWGYTGENRVPAVMETKHSLGISSLAISGDNYRVFSTELDANCKNRLIIHDTKTTKTVRSLALDSFVVLSMSLQSGNPNGNILALVSGSDRLRIFDVRKNNMNRFRVAMSNDSTPMMFSSVMFSPIDENQILLNGYCGSVIIDIRQPKSSPFPCLDGIFAQYSKSGNYLLCTEIRHLLAVYDISNGISKKIELTAQDYKSVESPESRGRGRFAGKDDSLVVATSGGNIFVWSLPDGNEFQEIDQPLIVLPGTAYDVCYSHHTNSLVSFNDKESVIKLWSLE